MAVVQPETLSHGTEINESTAGLPALAQSKAGAPYQSEHPDLWQAGGETAGAKGPRDQTGALAERAESPPLCAPEYGIHKPFR